MGASRKNQHTITELGGHWLFKQNKQKERPMNSKGGVVTAINIYSPVKAGPFGLYYSIKNLGGLGDSPKQLDVG